MGWLFMRSLGGHANPKAYLDAQFTWANADGTARILKSSMVGSVYYGALERCEAADATPKIVGVVCLTRFNPRDKDGYIFGYKDMDESAGPTKSDCPAGILDLLTPTSYEYAIAWRERCRTNLAKKAEDRAKPRPKHGDIVVLAEPIKFTDGRSLDRFQAVQYAHRRNLVFRSTVNGGLYRISNLKCREYRIEAPDLTRKA